MSNQIGILNGHISNSTSLNGKVYNKNILSAKIKTRNVLSGVMQISKKQIEYEKYKGLYDITPTIDKQELQTEKKVMIENLTIESIPFYEVANPTGETIIIG